MAKRRKATGVDVSDGYRIINPATEEQDAERLAQQLDNRDNEGRERGAKYEGPGGTRESAVPERRGGQNVVRHYHDDPLEERRQAWAHGPDGRGSEAYPELDDPDFTDPTDDPKPPRPDDLIGDDWGSQSDSWPDVVCARRVRAIYEGVVGYSPQALHHILGRRLTAHREQIDERDLPVETVGDSRLYQDNERVPAVDAGSKGTARRQEALDAGALEADDSHEEIAESWSFACRRDEYLEERAKSPELRDAWRRLAGAADPAMLAAVRCVSPPGAEPDPYGEPALADAWPEALLTPYYGRKTDPGLDPGDDVTWSTVSGGGRSVYLSDVEEQALTKLGEESESVHRERCLNDPAASLAAERQWAQNRRRLAEVVEDRSPFPEHSRVAVNMAASYDEVIFDTRERLRFCGRVAAAVGREWETPGGASQADQEFIGEVSEAYPVIAKAVRIFDRSSPLAVEPSGDGAEELVPRWRAAVAQGIDEALADRAGAPGASGLDPDGVGLSVQADVVLGVARKTGRVGVPEQMMFGGSLAVSELSPPAVRAGSTHPPVPARPAHRILDEVENALPPTTPAVREACHKALAVLRAEPFPTQSLKDGTVVPSPTGPSTERSGHQVSSQAVRAAQRLGSVLFPDDSDVTRRTGQTDPRKIKDGVTPLGAKIDFHPARVYGEQVFAGRLLARLSGAPVPIKTRGHDYLKGSVRDAGWYCAEMALAKVQDGREAAPGRDAVFRNTRGDSTVTRHQPSSSLERDLRRERYDAMFNARVDRATEILDASLGSEAREGALDGHLADSARTQKKARQFATMRDSSEQGSKTQAQHGQIAVAQLAHSLYQRLHRSGDVPACGSDGLGRDATAAEVARKVVNDLYQDYPAPTLGGDPGGTRRQLGAGASDDAHAREAIGRYDDALERYDKIREQLPALHPGNFGPGDRKPISLEERTALEASLKEARQALTAADRERQAASRGVDRFSVPDLGLDAEPTLRPAVEKLVGVRATVDPDRTGALAAVTDAAASLYERLHADGDVVLPGGEPCSVQQVAVKVGRAVAENAFVDNEMSLPDPAYALAPVPGAPAGQSGRMPSADSSAAKPEKPDDPVTRDPAFMQAVNRVGRTFAGVCRDAERDPALREGAARVAGMVRDAIGERDPAERHVPGGRPDLASAAPKAVVRGKNGPVGGVPPPPSAPAPDRAPAEPAARA